MQTKELIGPGGCHGASPRLWCCPLLSVDRSMGCMHQHAIIFLFLASIPNSGIQAWSMHSMLVRLENTLIVWAPLLHLFVSLPHILLMTTTLFDEAAQDWPNAYSYVRLVPHLTYGLYHIFGLLGVCLSYFSGHDICSEGLLEAIIETFTQAVLWFNVRR
jgi:hypothetical protein